MARRLRGEGSIYQRSSDGRWVGVLDLGYVNGKRKRRSLYGDTAEEVREQLEEAKRQRHDGALMTTDARLTVDAYLQRWLEVTRASVRQSTWRRYESLVRVHISPRLGRRRIQALRPDDLQALYADCLNVVSPRTVVHVHRVLHSALAKAVRWGVIAHNPAHRVDPPRVPRKEMQTLTSEEARALLQAARTHRLEALFVVALATGARQGELFALRWSDIDLDRGRMRIVRTLARGTDGSRIVTETKSGGGGRSMEVDALVVEALRRHRVRQTEEMLSARDWADDHLVFTTKVGTWLDGVSVLRRDLRPLLKAAGLPPIRFHDLRHSAASIALEQGVPAKVVSERLGHSNVAITLDTYSHVSPTMQRAASEAIGAALRGS